MTPTALAFSLDRTVDIRARRSTVFRFFTDTDRFARWWGPGSAIEPVVGGSVKIVYPGNTTASGHVTEIVPDTRIAFTYGYDAPGGSIPPGGSLVTIELVDSPDGTRVVLRHDVADAKTRDEHVQGWRYVLALFANVASADALGGAPDAIATWFTAWNEPDADRRRELLEPIVDPAVSFRDANGCVAGFEELLLHIGACQKFMPGIRLEPRGKVRSSHGTAIIDWAAMKGDTAAMSGTNVVRFATSGSIVDVIGIGA